MMFSLCRFLVVLVFSLVMMSKAICEETVPFSLGASVTKNGESHFLKLELTNVSERKLVFADTILSRDDMVLVLVADGAFGKRLEEPFGQLSSGIINKLVLHPKEVKEFNFNLSTIFPALNATLTRWRVVVFWSTELYNVNAPRVKERFGGFLMLGDEVKEQKMLSEEDLELW